MEIKTLAEQIKEGIIRPAELSDYLTWLEGFLLDGGVPSHYYNYPWQGCRFMIAWEDFTTARECGARACEIIVPYGVSYLGGEMGHNNFYFYEELTDKFSVRGHFVPVYDDPEFEQIPQLREFIKAGKLECEKHEIERQQRELEILKRPRYRHR